MISSLFLVSFLMAQNPGQEENLEQKAKAQTMLREGSVLYDGRAYVQALEKFTAAFAVYPSPKLLFNIGQANLLLDRPVQAFRAFEEFLTKAVDASLELREEANETLATLREKLTRLHIDCASIGAEISVDGKSIGKAPITFPVWVLPGQHQITARKQGAIPLVEDIFTHAGEVHAFKVVMKKIPTAVSPSRQGKAEDDHSSAVLSQEARGMVAMVHY
jgi:tetratricopeptide (TPR) repeat protein